MAADDAFLVAIKTNPADDTARLVYADWLDDHDEAEKAEYLRSLSRLGVVGFAAPEGVVLEARIRQLESALDPKWTTTVGALFEVGYLGIASTWWSELRRILEQEIGQGDTWYVLDRSAPGVLLDGLRAGEARDASARLNARLTGSIHAMAGRGEYFEQRRSLYDSQVVHSGRYPFAAYPTAYPTEPRLRRFEVVVRESGDQFSATWRQNPTYLAEPLCSLLGIQFEDATALLYSGVPFVVRGDLSFAAAARVLAEHRKAFKRHHLSRPLAEAVSLEIRPAPIPSADSAREKEGES